MLSYCRPHFNNEPMPENRARHKTFSSFSNEKFKQEVGEQYSYLTLESVKRNYGLTNLKPFTTQTSVDQLEKQVSDLNIVASQSRIRSSVDLSLRQKLQLLIKKNCNRNHKTAKRKHSLHSNVKFIKSSIEDDFLNLVEDYEEDHQLDRMAREKTIQRINDQIRSQYPSQVNTLFKLSKNNRILGFKHRDVRVSNAYENDKYESAQGRRSNSLEIKKQDYGIYSRSAKKTFYYSKKAEEIKRAEPEQNKKMTQLYYKSYMGSYSKRKKILASPSDSKALL